MNSEKGFSLVETAILMGLSILILVATQDLFLVVFKQIKQIDMSVNAEIIADRVESEVLAAYGSFPRILFGETGAEVMVYVGCYSNKGVLSPHIDKFVGFTAMPIKDADYLQPSDECKGSAFEVRVSDNPKDNVGVLTIDVIEVGKLIGAKITIAKQKKVLMPRSL